MNDLSSTCSSAHLFIFFHLKPEKGEEQKIGSFDMEKMWKELDEREMEMERKMKESELDEMRKVKCERGHEMKKRMILPEYCSPIMIRDESIEIPSIEELKKMIEECMISDDEINNNNNIEHNQQESRNKKEELNQKRMRLWRIFTCSKCPDGECEFIS